MKIMISGLIAGALLTPFLLGLSETATVQEPGPAQEVSEADELLASLTAEANEAYKVWVTDLRQKMAEATAAGEELPPSAYERPYGQFVPKFAEAAQKFAGTEGAVGFLSWLATTGMQSDFEAGLEAMRTLFSAHTKSPQLKNLGGMLPRLADMVGAEEAADMIERIEADSPVPEVRAWAAYARNLEVLENADVTSEAFLKAKQEMQDLCSKVSDASLNREVDGKIVVRESFSIGMVAPDIVGTDLDGTDFKLSDYKGKVVFVDFWGDW